MDRIGAAAERFSSALVALEQRLAELAKARDDAADLRARLAAAAEEREQLLARIARLEEEQASLMEVSGEIEGRLDGAIAEIRTALGR
ncbi:MAG TPA: DUF4164 family protein [Rhizomicrobium sp.]|jgi:chromosome segregation ATPase|nr:DUF4164 family protein [Rhizomicrobium sp.]